MKAKTKIFVLSNHNKQKWTLTPTRMFTVSPENSTIYIVTKAEVARVLSDQNKISFAGTTGRVNGPKVSRLTVSYGVHRNFASGSIAFGCKRFNAANVDKLKKWAGVA